MSISNLRKGKVEGGDALIWKCHKCKIEHFFPWESRYKIPGDGFACPCGGFFHPSESVIREWESKLNFNS